MEKYSFNPRANLSYLNKQNSADKYNNWSQDLSMLAAGAALEGPEMWPIAGLAFLGSEVLSMFGSHAHNQAEEEQRRTEQLQQSQYNNALSNRSDQSMFSSPAEMHAGGHEQLYGQIKQP